MSIRERLEDAYFLLEHGRDSGALLSTCVAIAATSRRRYPDRKRWKDRIAFTTFLAEEMRLVTAGAVSQIHVGVSVCDLEQHPNGYMPLEDALYDFVRCSLAHEGRLHAKVAFDRSERVSFNAGDELVIGGGVFRRLMLVPEYAPENGAEFPDVSALTDEELGKRLFGERYNHPSCIEYLTVRRTRPPA